MADVRTYNLVKGEVFERLVVIKDRRTRRRRIPTEAAAGIRIAEGDLAGDYVLPVEITSEGAVLIKLSATETKWLPVGEHSWDMVCIITRSALLTSTPLVEQVVVKGTITVTDYDPITPRDLDDLSAEALTEIV